MAGQLPFNPLIIFCVISAHLLLIDFFHWYAIVLLVLTHATFSYDSYRTWCRDISHRKPRTDRLCPSYGMLPRPCAGKKGGCPLASTDQLKKRVNSSVENTGMKPKTSSLDMDHLFVSFPMYLSVLYTVGLNATCNWAYNTVLLVLRDFLHKRNLIRIAVCDYDAKVADLILNGLQAIHLKRITDDKGRLLFLNHGSKRGRMNSPNGLII